MKVEDVHRLFEAAFNAGDIEALMSFYEAGAVFASEPGQQLRGLAHIRHAFDHMIATQRTMRLETIAAFENGDIGLLQGRSRTTGPGPDGQPLEMSGVSNEVVRRQCDGRWRYIIDNPFSG